MCGRCRREGIQPWIGDGQLYHQGAPVATIHYRIRRVVDVRYSTVDGRTLRQEGAGAAAGTYVVRRGTVPADADDVVLELCDGRRTQVSIDGDRLNVIGDIL